MFCRKCGNEIPEDSAFCPKCGMKVVTDNIEDAAVEIVSSTAKIEKSDTLTTVKPGSLICKECGKTIPQGNMFCPVCGTDVPSIEIAVSDSPSKKSKLMLILISTGALAAVLVIILFAVILPERHSEFYYKRDEDHKYYIILGAKQDMKEINIPDTIWFKPVRVIEDMAFAYSNAESVSFGKNISEIGDSAFESCTQIKKVEFKSDKNIRETLNIGANSFHNCSSLSSITFPNRNTTIGDYAFGKCKNVSFVDLSYVEKIGRIAFAESGVKSIRLSCDVGLAAFSKCTNLNDVYINTGAKLSNNVFEGCSNLKEATVWVSTIPPHTFSMCSSLEKVYWKSSNNLFAEIGDNAFVNCGSLSEIVTYEGDVLETPDDITDYNPQITIGDGAFDGCIYFRDFKLFGQGTNSSDSNKSLKDYTGMELSEMSYKTFTEKFGMPESYFWGKAQYSGVQVGFTMTGDYGTSGDGFDPNSNRQVDYIIVVGGTDTMINQTMHLGEGLEYYDNLLSFDVYNALTMGAGDHGMQWYELNVRFSSGNTPVYNVCIMFDADTMKSYAAKIEHL